MTRRLAVLMAVASGLTVANLYYNQPLLELMARGFGTDAGGVAAVPLLTQLGYAAAMLLLVPLGDVVERRALVVCTAVAAGAALTLSALAPSAAFLAAASLFTGFASAVPQMLLPFGARLAAPGERGRVIGTIMGGLLIGVLGARIVSGQVGAWWGWRAVFAAAAALMLGVAVVLRLSLPRDEPVERLPYGRLLRSIGGLFLELSELREAAFTGACSFAAFSAFWATLVFYLGAAYGWGSSAAGLFGLVGIVGALAAPLVGRSSDVRSPRWGVRVGTSIALAGYAFFALVGHHLGGLIAGVVLLDLGAQAALVSNQARIYALRPDTPSRVNTVFMVGYFCGGAVGSGLGSVAWQRWAWPGVCGVGVASLVLALLALARPAQVMRSRNRST